MELLGVFEAYLEELRTPPPATHGDPPQELQRTGRPFGGLIADIQRRAPHYLSDFTDGLNSKSLATVLFLFFACIAPTVAFGGLLSVLTGGEIGVLETLLGTAVAGVVYALFAGQPLSILGSTGPIVVFLGVLYQACRALELPFLPTLACIGLWTAVFLAALAVLEASRLIHWFTRFTDEIFAALISLIFIAEALHDTLSGFSGVDVEHDSALLGLLLALGTFQVALGLSSLRRRPYLTRFAREFLADFGPAIAITVMTSIAFALHPVDLVTLTVPEHFAPTLERSWFVSPLDAPRWVLLASAGPALLVTVLLYLDQNITVRLVNNPDHRLVKGGAYHLDLLVLAALIGGFSLFGLPWVAAATVRSLNHVRALAETENRGGTERIVEVRETRVTGLAVHLLIGLSLLALDLLRLVPMAVLFGLFLFMGVASLRGNQFVERMRLWIMDPAIVPPTHYLSRVPRAIVHRYTLVQALGRLILWVVKASAIAVLFPLVIALLVPLRLLLDRVFEPGHLAFLDAAETPDEEAFQELD